MHRLALLLALTACGRAGPRAEPPDAPDAWTYMPLESYQHCRDAYGQTVGQFMGRRSDAGMGEPEGTCLHAVSGGEWAIDRVTARPRPFFDYPVNIVYEDISCSGEPYVLCMANPCTTLSFRTTDGVIRAAVLGTTPVVRTFSSSLAQQGKCTAFILAGPVPSIRVSEAPPLEPPSRAFYPPLTAGP